MVAAEPGIVSSEPYGAAGAFPEHSGGKPARSLIEGHAGKRGPAHTPRIRIDLPFFGRVWGRSAFKVGTVSHQKPRNPRLRLDSTVFGFAQRTKSPPTRAQSSPLAGRVGPSPFPAPRQAPQRRLRGSAWSGGISQRSLRAVGKRRKVRLERADSGFFEDNLLSFLEERCLL